MRHVKILFGIVVLLAVSVAVMTSPTPMAAEPAAQGGASIVTSAIQTLSDAPWTKEQMESAIPYPIPSPSGQAKVPSSAPLEANGPGGAIQGGLPGTTGAPKAINLGAQATSGVWPLGYSYPAPFNRYLLQPNSLYTTYPWMTTGKVFFTQNGLNYVCSGSSAGGGRMVWTAAHCLYSQETDKWDTRFTFIPGYRAGSAPFGQWSYSQLAAWSMYTTSNSEAYDYGVALMYNQGGLKISQRVGYLGLAWNWNPAGMFWNSFGYPAASPFNGLYMYSCQGSYAYSDAAFSPNPVAIGCDMTGGCSGGPWIFRWLSGNYLNGVNAYRYTNHPLELFSPYFNSYVKNLYDWGIAR